ncbi:uncharacterized protein MEPE_05604 [Melanopsichium pennsylvanicum]|uniref:Uncharacterized protein n=1 Tax=Melanopsichium pennsylvanicum TaxID=63383 RepID=A0AAJ5C7H6_9BASI|nr:uncharacterized protein MEPE_05604 [Melanopsichium pennsylvanicum]
MLGKGCQLCSKLVKPTVKLGSSCIMIWGCMAWKGVDTMCMVFGRMDSSQYNQMLDEKLTKTMLEMCNRCSYTNLIFQQDIDLKHWSKKTKNWLKDKNIDVMEWSAQSSNLNPTENLLGELKK